MYLLIGHESDPCSLLVTGLLHKRGHTVLTTINPLADERLLTWTFDTTASHSTLRWPGVAVLDDCTLHGVLVCTPGGLSSVEGWEPQDLAYVQAEMASALVAWLHVLPCAVINRPTADLWFRSQRPLPEWRMYFDRCGLPSLVAQITNNLDAARRFAARWDGCVIYTPLTSQTRYPLVDDSQWLKLAKVMERMPVCLVEPTADTPIYTTIVGRQIFWSGASVLTMAEAADFERGLYRLAELLKVEVLQVELRSGVGGLRCSGIHLYPLLGPHTPEDQAAIAAGIVELLTA
jgi:hypothetical protein